MVKPLVSILMITTIIVLFYVMVYKNISVNTPLNFHEDRLLSQPYDDPLLIDTQAAKGVIRSLKSKDCSFETISGYSTSVEFPCQVLVREFTSNNSLHLIVDTKVSISSKEFFVGRTVKHVYLSESK